VLIEENKSDDDQQVTRETERFEVIREDTGGNTAAKDSFYSPARIAEGGKDNSDFKKFDDHEQYAQAHEGRWPQRNAENFGGNSIEYREKDGEDLYTDSCKAVLTLGATDETPLKAEDALEDTPKNIKDRGKKSFFEQQQLFGNSTTIAGGNMFGGGDDNQILRSTNFGDGQ
jgi:hypothetical protein